MKLARLKSLKLPYRTGFGGIAGDTAGIYVGDDDQNVYALEPADYRIRWELAAKGYDPRLVIGDTLVLVMVETDRLRVLREL
jgi:hypothetical protein